MSDNAVAEREKSGCRPAFAARDRQGHDRFVARCDNRGMGKKRKRFLKRATRTS